MKKLIKWALVIAVIATGGYFGYFFWLSQQDTTVKYRTAAITRGDLVVLITATGTVEPEEIVDVGAQVAGRIESLGSDPSKKSNSIDYGSIVKKGMVLARLDDASYQAAVDIAKANLKLAKAEMAQFQAKHVQAEADWNRAQTLGKSISQASKDKTQAEYQMAKASLEVGEAAIQQATAKLEQANVDLAYVTIKSPIDGIVIDRRVNVGQTVVTGLNAPSLYLLATDLSRLEVWASVNEADIGLIRVGQPVTFSVDAYTERSFPGEVIQTRLNASMVQNVVTYTVIISCDNSDGKLLPYMTANLKFEVARADDAIVVPNRALRWRPPAELVHEEHREWFYELEAAENGADVEIKDETPTPKHTKGVVWVEAGEGMIRPIEVEVGLSDGLRSEIRSKQLTPDDEVVLGEVRIDEEDADFTSTFVQLPK